MAVKLRSTLKRLAALLPILILAPDRAWAGNAVEVDDITGPVRVNFENYNATTYGKVAFVRQSVPWCGYCREMIPAWNELGRKYRNHPDILIGELTCTSDILEDGMLCQHFHDLYGTEAYPSILYGDPFALKIHDDEGERRSFIEMDSFVKKFERRCAPWNLDLCDEESTERILKYSQMDINNLKIELNKIEDMVAASKEAYLKEARDFEDFNKEFHEVQEHAVNELGVGRPRPPRLAVFEKNFGVFEKKKALSMDAWKDSLSAASVSDMYMMKNILESKTSGEVRNEETEFVSDEL